MDYINVTKIRLLQNAMEYLEIGLSEFHNAKDNDQVSFQPAIGNLSISIELMLKSIIAHNAFIFLFANIPLDFQIYLSYPELLKDEKTKRVLEVKFLHSKFDTIELSKCITIFNLIHPEKKSELSGYFKILNEIRNTSVHFIFPSFQKYDLHRVAILAIRLFEIIQSNKELYHYCYYSLNKHDKGFIETFNNERNEKVREKIEKAKEKAPNAKDEILDCDGFDNYIRRCPVCKKDCYIFGYTMDSATEDGELVLLFHASSLVCPQCELELNDIEELKSANVELVYDRTDERDTWLDEEYVKYYEHL